MATPSTTAHHPGATNVFVPGSGFQQQATVDLQIEFHRTQWPFNQIAQLVPTEQSVGYYVSIDSDDAVRIVNDEDFVWPDGDDRPRGETRRHLWKKFSTQRYDYGFRIGRKTERNAAFDIRASQARGSGMKAMTHRMLQLMTVLSTSGNWPADNTSATLDALGVSSGSWDTSSTSNNYIEKSIHRVVEKILFTTAGAVQPGDISLIVNPTRAHTMRETAELHQYIINNESSIPSWQQTGVFASFGLPPQLFGVNLIVDSSVKVTTREGESTQTRAFALGDDVAVFVSRPGGLMGVEGAVSFSTVTAFMHEGMTVEAFDDERHRRIDGHVVDDRDIVLSAPASGYLLQDVTT